MMRQLVVAVCCLVLASAAEVKLGRQQLAPTNGQRAFAGTYRPPVNGAAATRTANFAGAYGFNPATAAQFGQYGQFGRAVMPYGNQYYGNYGNYNLGQQTLPYFGQAAVPQYTGGVVAATPAIPWSLYVQNKIDNEAVMGMQPFLGNQPIFGNYLRAQPVAAPAQQPLYNVGRQPFLGNQFYGQTGLYNGVYNQRLPYQGMPYAQQAVFGQNAFIGQPAVGQQAFARMRTNGLNYRARRK